MNLLAIMRNWNERTLVHSVLSGDIFSRGCDSAMLWEKNSNSDATSEIASPMLLLVDFIKKKYGEATKETKTLSLPICAVLGILLDIDVPISAADTPQLLQRDLQQLVFESAKTYVSQHHNNASMNAFISILDDKHLDKHPDEFPLQPSEYNTPLDTFEELRETRIIMTVQEILRRFW